MYKGTKYCTALDFPTLSLVVAAFSDNTVKVIDSGTAPLFKELVTFQFHNDSSYNYCCINTTDPNDILGVTGSQEVVGDLSTGDGGAVTSLSHHEGGRYMLTCSTGSGALWDLQTFNRKRMLAGASVVGLKEVGVVG